MAQFLRPDGNITTTGFTGGFSAIDEATFNDADFAYGANGGGNTLEVSLSNPPVTPASVGNCTVRTRLAQTNNGVLAATGNAVSITVGVYQGTTLIFESSLGSLYDFFSPFTQTFAASLVSDWNDLRIRITDGVNGGSPSGRRGGAISWAELEVPDPPATPVGRQIELRWDHGGHVTGPDLELQWFVDGWVPPECTFEFLGQALIDVDPGQIGAAFNCAAGDIILLLIASSGGDAGVPVTDNGVLPTEETPVNSGLFGNSNLCRLYCHHWIITAPLTGCTISASRQAAGSSAWGRLYRIQNGDPASIQIAWDDSGLTALTTAAASVPSLTGAPGGSAIVAVWTPSLEFDDGANPFVLSYSPAATADDASLAFGCSIRTPGVGQNVVNDDVQVEYSGIGGA